MCLDGMSVVLGLTGHLLCFVDHVGLECTILANICLSVSFYQRILLYNRTSMTRTSLGAWKFVRDMGSASH